MLFSEEHFSRGLRRLARVDKTMGKIIRIVRPVVPAPRTFDFSTFVKVIINQQLSSAAANTIYSRLIKHCNGRVTPDRVAKLSDATIQSCGISRSKTLFIREAYAFSISNPLIFKSLKNDSIDDAKEALLQIKGIGEWSASIILMFYLGNLDIFPKGDTTLNNAVMKLYSGTDLADVTENWRPYRSVASLTLWRWVDSGSPTF